jgi:hypothetical protein
MTTYSQAVQIQSHIYQPANMSEWSKAGYHKLGFRITQHDDKLEFYHTRLIATDRQKIERHVINEVTYLALATPENATMLSVSHVYPVSKVELRAENGWDSLPQRYPLLTR